MFSEIALPAEPELSVACTPGTRRSTSPMLDAPLSSIAWWLTTVRAPAKVFTLFCRPLPSQSPDTLMVSSTVVFCGSFGFGSDSCANAGSAIDRHASAASAAQRVRRVVSVKWRPVLAMMRCVLLSCVEMGCRRIRG